MQKLVARLDETLSAMSGMLNALLDINEIKDGTVHAEKAFFPINDLLARVGGEFAYQAQARGFCCAWSRAACRYTPIRACSSKCSAT